MIFLCDTTHFSQILFGRWESVVDNLLGRKWVKRVSVSIFRRRLSNKEIQYESQGGQIQGEETQGEETQGEKASSIMSEESSVDVSSQAFELQGEETQDEPWTSIQAEEWYNIVAFQSDE
jgi:hypothetical protein